MLATLAASSTEAAAIQGAVERIAECFDSEVGGRGQGTGSSWPRSASGRGQALPPALIDVASGVASEVVVPGAGRCRAVVVPVPSEPPCRLVLARSGDDGFSVEEVSLLRSMGRIVATALDMLHLRDRVAASEVRFRRIVETANEGIWLLDADGGTTFANGKVAEILGFPPEEMASLTIFDVVDDQGKPYVARNLERRRQGVSDQLECAFLRKDGSYVWVLLHASPILDGDGTYAGSLCMVSDISGRKRIETELASARDAAMEASRLKSDFLATMSHEIRTPMNGVIGLTGLLLTTELDDRQRQYAHGVQTAGEALLGIINDILDFSKIEAGRLELEVIDFDLVQVVEEAAALVAESAQSKGLELLVSCAPDLPATVRGDPARLRQVLLNLASNAVKFTADGEVVVRVGIESEVGDDGVRRLRGGRHRHRHLRGRRAPPVRAVLPGRRVDHPALRRHRARPGDLPAPGHGHGRGAGVREPARPGQHLPVHPSARAPGGDGRRRAAAGPSRPWAAGAGGGRQRDQPRDPRRPTPRLGAGVRPRAGRPERPGPPAGGGG